MAVRSKAREVKRLPEPEELVGREEVEDEVPKLREGGRSDEGDDGGELALERVRSPKSVLVAGAVEGEPWKKSARSLPVEKAGEGGMERRAEPEAASSSSPSTSMSSNRRARGESAAMERRRREGVSWKGFRGDGESF